MPIEQKAERVLKMARNRKPKLRTQVVHNISKHLPEDFDDFSKTLNIWYKNQTTIYKNKYKKKSAT